MLTSIQRILFTITGVGWLAVLSTFLFPVYTFGDGTLWGVAILAMAGLSCLSVMSFLRSRWKNKEIWAGQSVFKKIVSFLGILLLTVITAIVAFIVMFVISMMRNPQSMSTYGTPIHRPKIN